MKIKLLTAIAVLLSLCGYAQTKGTSALGLGISINTNKVDYGLGSGADNSEYKMNAFTLGYGYFNEDNTKIGVEFTYGNTHNTYTASPIEYKAKSYSGTVTYQKYYPLVKGLYYYAGGDAGFGYTKSDNTSSDQKVNSGSTNQYSVGAYGGLTWFVSKRFAFETDLLSANIYYAKTSTDNGFNDNPYTSKTTSFNLKTQGVINNLGFKIYLLF